MRTYSCDTRNMAVRMYVDKKLGSLRHIQQITDIGKSSVQRWTKQHPYGRALAAQRRRSSLFAKAGQVITDFLREKPLVTAEHIRAHLRQQCNLHGSVSTVSRTVRRLGWTPKRPSISTHDDSDPELLSQRVAFTAKVASIEPTDVVSIDESAFYLNMSPARGYAPRGARFHVTRTKKLPRTRMTLMLAVAASGVVGWELFQGNGNGKNFGEFITNLDFGSHKYALLDNVKFHDCKIVRQAFDGRHVEALFLPKYTPQWQPVEHVFHTLKHQYRHTDMCEGSFEERVLG